MSEENVDHEYHTKMEGVMTETGGRKRKPEDDKIGDSGLTEDASSSKRLNDGSGDSAAGTKLQNGKTGTEEKLNLEKLSLADVMAAIDKSAAKTQASVDEVAAEVRGFGLRLSGAEKAADGAASVAMDAQAEISRLREEMDLMRRDMERLENAVPTYSYRNDMKDVRLQLERQEAFSRRFNLIIEGIPECENETDTRLYGMVSSFLSNEMGLTTMTFDICHRLGSKTGRGDRRVILKFPYLKDKNVVWEARSVLKKSARYRLLQDKPRSTKEREALSFKIVRAAQLTSEYRSVRFQYGKVWLDGTGYDYEDFEFLPANLRPAYICSPRSENLIAFFSKHSPLSNHFMSPFHVEGRSYACMEQYLARSRALMAKNFRFAAKAMNTSDPIEHKKLLETLKEDGKQEMWITSLDNWLVPGLKAKFSQNAYLRDFLLNTGERRIGEATFDLTWGIGIDLRHPQILNEVYWTGMNKMGRALEKVREQISSGN